MNGDLPADLGHPRNEARGVLIAGTVAGGITLGLCLLGLAYALTSL